MGVHPAVTVTGWLEVHRFGMTEIAAIAGVGLNVARDALRHRREIRFAGHFRFVDAFVTRQTRNRGDMLVMRKPRERKFARLLDGRRWVMTSNTRFGPRQIVVLDARTGLHRNVARGAFELQCQVRAVREIRGWRKRSEGRQRG